MAFNSRSQGTLRKLHHAKAAFDRCTTLNHVHDVAFLAPRNRGFEPRGCEPTTDRVPRVRASFRWQAKRDRCLDLVINSPSQALVPLIPAPIQRKTQPALASTPGETSSIILAFLNGSRPPIARWSTRGEGKFLTRSNEILDKTHDFLDRRLIGRSKSRGRTCAVLSINKCGNKVDQVLISRYYMIFKYYLFLSNRWLNSSKEWTISRAEKLE